MDRRLLSLLLGVVLGCATLIPATGPAAAATALPAPGTPVAGNVTMTSVSLS